MTFYPFSVVCCIMVLYCSIVFVVDFVMSMYRTKAPVLTCHALSFISVDLLDKHFGFTSKIIFRSSLFTLWRHDILIAKIGFCYTEILFRLFGSTVSLITQRCLTTKTPSKSSFCWFETNLIITIFPEATIIILIKRRLRMMKNSLENSRNRTWRSYTIIKAGNISIYLQHR